MERFLSSFMAKMRKIKVEGTLRTKNRLDKKVVMSNESLRKRRNILTRIEEWLILTMPFFANSRVRRKRRKIRIRRRKRRRTTSLLKSLKRSPKRSQAQRKVYSRKKVRFRRRADKI